MIEGGLHYEVDEEFGTGVCWGWDEGGGGAIGRGCWV